MMGLFLRIAIGVVVLGAVAFVGLMIAVRSSETLQDGAVKSLMRTVAEQQLARQNQTDVPADERLGANALDVIFCGTASPMGRSERAQSCIAIFAGPHFYLIDTGPGSIAKLQQQGLPLGELDGVLLTHFHSDHIGNLGEVHLQSWVGGRKKPLPIYGGKGVESIVAGFNFAYGQDYVYRTDHHGASVLQMSDAGLSARLITLGANGRGPVIAGDGLRIRAFRVNHAPIEPALGFEIEYRGRRVIVSGDTVKQDLTEEVSRGADVLIHDALAPHLTKTLAQAMEDTGNTRLAKLIRDTLDYHASPVEAAEIANAANVQLLVLTHLAPVPPTNLMAWIFARGVSDLRGDDAWMLADDGLHLRLPAQSDDIDISER